MTEQEAKNKLIELASSQVGYRESGDNNVKYNTGAWDDVLYGWNTEGQPWCDIFVDWCFTQAFGFDTGKQMTYQYNGCNGAACRESANYYQTHGAYYQYPEVGDQIFFYYNGAINHTGIVERVNGSTVTTIEGNSSDSVRRNNYTIGTGTIAGYGRPKWSLVGDVDKTEEVNVPTTESSEGSISVKVGDLVKIKSGATWYNGASIPDFVMNQNWVVFAVYGDRVVLNWNESHTDNIMSPIDVKYLEMVDDSELPVPEIEMPDGTYCRTYTVEKGDTLWGIAEKYLGSGTKYRELMDANGLVSTVIKPGDVLVIPS